MSMDPALQTFIAESRELLRHMETALLDAERDQVDADAINAIFRAVHTIKGSSGLFGLDPIVAFTHVVESVLDRVRAQQLVLDKPLIAVLLACGDHMERLVDAVANDGMADGQSLATAGHSLLQRLGAISGATNGHVPAPVALPAAAGQMKSWHISVRFHGSVLKNGMDPLSFVRYLGTLGAITALQVLDEQLPPVDEFDPETCYLGFAIDLDSDATEQRIEGAFEFVRDDCTLSITSRQPSIDAAVATASEKVCAGTPTKSARADARSLRVDGDKLDRLIDLIGELVTAGAATTIAARKAGLVELNESTLRLARLVEGVRDQALQLRMVQIGPTFTRFQRIVRDVAQQLGKQITLEIAGGETELDKTLVESIADPLTHLVRNAIDHGIETAEVRRSCGKPVHGTIRLNAYHDSGSVLIEVSDDGGGLKRERIAAKAMQCGLIADADALSDSEVYQLIFEPGFTTAEQVTNLSGRGVGMDVVKRNVAALRGTVELDSRRSGAHPPAIDAGHHRRLSGWRGRFLVRDSAGRRRRVCGARRGGAGGR